jgi:S1-C subfamily serine protease
MYISVISMPKTNSEIGTKRPSGSKVSAMVNHSRLIKTGLAYASLLGALMAVTPGVSVADWGDAILHGVIGGLEEMKKQNQQDIENNRKLEQQKKLIEHQYELERQRMREQLELERQQQQAEIERERKRAEEEYYQKIAEEERKRKEVEEARRNAVNIGTGFFIAPDGYVVTNHHVIEDKTNYAIRDRSGKFYEARIIAADATRDLVVLKADGKFPSLKIGNSNKLNKGQRVLTVGYPQIQIQGSESKVTDGVVSSLSGLGNDPDWLQVSIPIQFREGILVGRWWMKMASYSELLLLQRTPQDTSKRRVTFLRILITQSSRMFSMHS